VEENPEPRAPDEANPPLVEALLDEPNERKPPGLPVLREERLEFLKPAELLAELPKECHWPSLIAERAFDVRFPDEPKLRAD
jgi:hypothetical protein